MRESPKLFFARRSAMPGDHAIIVTAAVSSKSGYAVLKTIPHSALGRLLLFSGIEPALSSN
jgi:hypothetical protein